MNPFRLCLLAAGALLAANQPAQAAEAGRLLFVLGQVEIERAGLRAPAARAAVVEIGDTVHTGGQGRTQLRMNDGGLIALRPASSFLVEDYTPPVAASVALPGGAAGVGTSAAASAVPGRAFMRLLRGGFRAISGLIGKSARDEYRVNTPVATIGIRGTDYSATYCNGDCGATPNGLHVGVSSGRVFISNNSGDINLDDDQYGYVPNAGAPPERGLEKPNALETVIEPSNDDDEADEEQSTPVPDNASPPPNDPPDNTESSGAENDDPNLPDEPQPGDERERSSAFVTGPLQEGPDVIRASFNGASTQANSGVTVDAQGDLTSFGGAHPSSPPGTAVYSIGTASNQNLGFDSASQLRWGRWSGGVATVSQSGQDGALNLGNRSLHWIAGPVGSEAVVLPISGSMSYVLVGNTDPTDLNGVRGVLGAASFSANFTNQTVSSSLSLSISNQTWNATGAGSIFDGSNLFEGDYSTVTVSGQQSNTDNTGQFAGFFTPGASGAGLSYALDNGSNAVYGVAAFGAAPPGP